MNATYPEPEISYYERQSVDALGKVSSRKACISDGSRLMPMINILRL